MACRRLRTPRVSKSRLMREAAAGRPESYFHATRLTDPSTLEQFKTKSNGRLAARPDPGRSRGLGRRPLSSRRDSQVASSGTNRRAGRVSASGRRRSCAAVDRATVLAFRKRSEGRVELILCGSAVSQMKDLLAERNPLCRSKHAGNGPTCTAASRRREIASKLRRSTRDRGLRHFRWDAVLIERPVPQFNQCAAFHGGTSRPMRR